MQPKTLLAISLSFLVLFAYNAYIGKNKQATPIASSIEIPQVIDNKQLKSDFLTVPQAPTENIPTLENKIDSIKTEKFVLEFSSIGGELSRAAIMPWGSILPLEKMFSIKGYDREQYEIQKLSGSKMRLVLNKPEISIVKTFELLRDDYTLKVRVDIVQNEMSKNTSSFNLFKFDSAILDKLKFDAHDNYLIEFAIKKDGKIERKGNFIKFGAQDGKEYLGNIEWIGFRDRYFAAIIQPISAIKLVKNEILGEKTVLNSVVLPDGSSSAEFLVYLGPQDLDLMKSLNKKFEEIVSFSGFGLFDSFSHGIYQSLRFIHKFIPSWGICIILISAIIYLALYPLTLQNLRSMKRMQELQPKIAKLKEQHANNPQKLNLEIVELYKTNKVNPLAGCLPLLMQMPFFIGLYQVLWRAVYLKGQSFLWIEDLSRPDRLITLPNPLPFMGSDVNILPIIMAGVMYFQQKMSAQSMVYSDPQMEQQQKMMVVIMPIMLGVLFYKFSSGFCLYFITFNTLSILLQKKFVK